MPQYVYIYRGLPGSRKTSHAKETQKKLLDLGIQSIILERDMIRDELTFGGYSRGGYYFDHETEKSVTDLQLSRMEFSLLSGLSVFISDTNLRDKYVRKFMDMADKYDVPVQVVDFRDVDLDTCLINNAKRPRKVPDDVIRDMYARYIKGRNLNEPIKPSGSKNTKGRVPDFSEVLPYTPPNSSSARQVVLVDMDGTLCNHNGRDPYDDSLYHEDLVFENVRDTVQALHDAGFQIDIMTGRYEKFRDVCTQWLVDNEIPFADLHMRHMDGRDDLVKQLMFEKHYRNNEDLIVRFAIDDRDRVVDMYRKVLGLQVFQVNYGDF